MKDVFISSIQLIGTGGGMRPSESISLRFSQIVMSYVSIENTGVDDKTYTDGRNAETNEAT